MAHRFEKGKSLFFLFKNGFSVQDSQLKPRYYLTLEKAKQYLPYGDEIVEYAPVKHGRWETRGIGTMNFCDNCSCIAFPHQAREWSYCPICGQANVVED